MMHSTLSTLLAVVLRMHQTLTYCCLHNQLIARRMKYLISFWRKIYSIVVSDKVLLCLCFVSKIIVCKDDDFSVLTATTFINKNIEKCTMMYRTAMRHGIDCCNNPTLLIWLVPTIFDWMGLNCYI